jgi:dihydroneopterin aldolase
VTDRIRLDGIEVLARHGVLDHERVELQRFLVDLTVLLDLRKAGASDDLADTVDYGRLAQEAHDAVAGESHQLIETVADRVATRLLGEPGVERVIVTVHKPDAPIPLEFADVSVTVDRAR